MGDVEENPSKDRQIGDPAELSAEAYAAGNDFLKWFDALPLELRQELIRPLVDTLTTTLVADTQLSSDASLELANSLDANTRAVQEHAKHQKFMEDHPPTESEPDLNY